MIYILDSTFELVFPGEARTRLRTGEDATFHSEAGIASPTSGGDKAAFSQSASIPMPTRTWRWRHAGTPPSHFAEIAYVFARRPAATASRPAIDASMGFARSGFAPTRQEVRR